MFALLGAAHFSALMVYAVLIGAVGGAFGVLIPLLMLESLGIKRFGSLMVSRECSAPWATRRTGRHRMDTRSHRQLRPALWLFVGVSIVCVVACFACRPLQSVLDERAREAA